MDLSGWAALLAVPAAAVAALYPWLRDRGDLTQVERITKVLNDAGETMRIPDRSALRVIRQRHIERMAITSAVPRGGALLTAAIFGWTWGSLIGTAETMLALGPKCELDLTNLVIVYAEVAVMVIIAAGSWHIRKRERNKHIAMIRQVLRAPDSFEESAAADQGS